MATRELKIFTSSLTDPPRYYASTAYKERRDKEHRVIGYLITGKKHDVTDQIEEIIKQRSGEKP